MKIAIINGPNLNLLGGREPELYGSTSFGEYLLTLRDLYPNVAISYFQSNIEGEIINQIQQQGNVVDGIILNPAGYTHTSVAIGDAIAAITCPVMEVHISNIFAREDFRKLSYVSSRAVGVISGLGLKGYELALQYFVK